MKKLIPLLLVAFVSPLSPLIAALPSDAYVEPEQGIEKRDGVDIATEPVKIELVIPEKTTATTLLLRVGEAKLTVPSLSIKLHWKDEERVDEIRLIARGEGQTPDQYLTLGQNKRFYIRPNTFYFATPARKERILQNWAKFPPASTTPLKVELKAAGSDLQVWYNDRLVDLYAGRGEQLDRIEMTLQKDAGVHDVSFSQEAPSPSFLPVPLERFARIESWYDFMGEMAIPNQMRSAKLSLPSGKQAVDGVPFFIAAAPNHIDVAHLGYLATPIDDLASTGFRRSSAEALPEACIISVPIDTYSHAMVLCAATGQEGKIPEFTVRLSRNANGRGDALADTRVIIPSDGNETPDAKIVGTVQFEGKEVPLWLLRVPLKNGLIQDVLREDERQYGFSTPFVTDRYLDLELMEPIDGSEEDSAFPNDPEVAMRRTFLPAGLRTSAHVFGLTLIKSPAELTVRSKTPGFAFYEEEQPALKAEVNIRQPGRYALEWNIADVDGKVVESGKRELDAKAPLEEAVEIPLKTGNGWFASQVKISESTGRTLVDHRGSFVILPPDTRKAGRESPFGTWWFNWAHGGTKDYTNVGRLMQRAGLRHTMLNLPNGDKLMEESKVTTWVIPWKQPQLPNWVEDLEAHIRKCLENTPEATTVMIHHETDSFDGRFPSELWGIEPKEQSEKSREAWEQRMKYLVEGLKMIRREFPQLKIQFGNTGDSCALVAEMFRLGLPKEFVDYVAVEDLGQMTIPERPGLGGVHSAWYLRETARHFGYTNAKVTGCYEWIGRMHTRIGTKLQAEYYMRDVLIALSYGFHTIAPATIHDAGQPYFHSIWGNGGFNYRYPYMYPKPSYAAMATLTHILDSAKFTRLAPTGSHSLYALEFERDGHWIYAIWTPRGERPVKMSFPQAGEITLTDTYGRETTLNGKEIDLQAKGGVCYVSAPAKLEAITLGKPDYRQDFAPPPNAQVVDTLDNESNWEIVGYEHQRRQGMNLPHRVPGEFLIQTVKDDEKGAAIEFELRPLNDLNWKPEQEFIGYESIVPIEVSGGPYEYIGLWVKGNSSFGEVNLRVVDGNEKERWLYSTYNGAASINHDGWAFLYFRLPKDGLWQGNVKILGMTITLGRNALYGNEYVPVENLRVRIKDLTVF